MKTTSKVHLKTSKSSLPFREIYVKYLEKNSINSYSLWLYYLAFITNFL